MKLVLEKSRIEILWCTKGTKLKSKQECIPVGCVPSALAAVFLGGVCLVRGGGLLLGGLLPGGVCSWGGGGWGLVLGGSGPSRGLLPGGAWSWGVPGPRGGGVCSQGCLVPGVVSQHALRQTPPLSEQNDRCKNITFATSLRTVIILALPKPETIWKYTQNDYKVLFIYETHWRI